MERILHVLSRVPGGSVFLESSSCSSSPELHSASRREEAVWSWATTPPLVPSVTHNMADGRSLYSLFPLSHDMEEEPIDHL